MRVLPPPSLMRAKHDVYYLWLNRKTMGPYTLGQLHDLWNEGQITADTPYVQVGAWKSRPLDHILNKVIGYQPPVETSVVEQLDLAEARGSSRVYVTAVVSVVLGGWLIGYAWNRSSMSQEVLAEIRESRARLNILNANDFDWNDMVITLNEMPPQGYRREIRTLKAGASTAFWLTDFVESTGIRFEPWRATVREVWIGNKERGYHRFKLPPREGPPVTSAVPPELELKE